MNAQEVNDQIALKKTQIDSLQQKIQSTHDDGVPLREEIKKSKDQNRIDKLENKLNMLFNRRLNLIYQVQAQKEQIEKLRLNFLDETLLNV